jgi:hypothetical protein
MCHEVMAYLFVYNKSTEKRWPQGGEYLQGGPGVIEVMSYISSIP